MKLKDFSIYATPNSPQYKHVSFTFETGIENSPYSFSFRLYDPTGEAEDIIRNVVVEILQYASLEGLLLISMILHKTIDAYNVYGEDDEDENDEQQLQ